MFKNLLFLLSFFLLSFSQTYGQNIKIHGVVTDKNSGVPFVTIEANRSIKTQTDTKGYSTFFVEAGKPVVLKTKAVGYKA